VPCPQVGCYRAGSPPATAANRHERRPGRAQRSCRRPAARQSRTGARPSRSLPLDSHVTAAAIGLPGETFLGRGCCKPHPEARSSEPCGPVTDARRRGRLPMAAARGAGAVQRRNSRKAAWSCPALASRSIRGAMPAPTLGERRRGGARGQTAKLLGKRADRQLSFPPRKRKTLFGPSRKGGNAAVLWPRQMGALLSAIPQARRGIGPRLPRPQARAREAGVAHGDGGEPRHPAIAGVGIVTAVTQLRIELPISWLAAEVALGGRHS